LPPLFLHHVLGTFDIRGQRLSCFLGERNHNPTVPKDGKVIHLTINNGWNPAIWIDPAELVLLLTTNVSIAREALCMYGVDAV